MFHVFAGYAFAIGAIIGSFVNVVIHRLPRGESLVRPRSRCPSCGTPIRWYDNVPIISWLILRARCRSCRTAIASRYVLVELATGLFFLAIWLHTGPSIGGVLLAYVVTSTIALIYIDLDVQLLPDVIDLPALAAGLGVGLIGLGNHYPRLVLSSSLVDSLAGAALGGGIVVGIGLIYSFVRGVQGIGMGDAKMLAMIGATVGFRGILPVMLLASLAATSFGLLVSSVRRQGRRAPLPLGVFLGLSLLGVVFHGRNAIVFVFELFLV